MILVLSLLKFSVSHCLCFYDQSNILCRWPICHSAKSATVHSGSLYTNNCYLLCKMLFISAADLWSFSHLYPLQCIIKLLSTLCWFLSKLTWQVPFSVSVQYSMALYIYIFLSACILLSTVSGKNESYGGKQSVKKWSIAWQSDDADFSRQLWLQNRRIYDCYHNMRQPDDLVSVGVLVPRRPYRQVYWNLLTRSCQWKSGQNQKS